MTLTCRLFWALMHRWDAARKSGKREYEHRLLRALHYLQQRAVCG